MIELTDLTKEELLRLIQTKDLQYYLNENDIKWIRIESMVNRARKIMDDAQNNMKQLNKKEDIPKYLEENKKWEKGKELWDKAQYLMENKA